MSVNASDGGASRPPTCFVSYSHDSSEHKQAVLDLVQALRAYGIDAHFDQFVMHNPPAYWPSWMVEQIEESDFVLVVVTETYARRFKQREEAGRGKGAAWEGAVITSQVYNSFGGHVKFIPVIFNKDDQSFIPFPLSETNYHQVTGFSQEKLRQLLHQLKRVPLVLPVPVGSGLSDADHHSDAEPNVDSISAAVQKAHADEEAAVTELTLLASSDNPRLAARAAFNLGMVLFNSAQYNRALEALQVALEYGPSSAVYEDTKREMANVLTVLQSHFGPDSAVAASYELIGLIQAGDIREAWTRIDRDMRLTLAQAWISSNAQHADLVGLDHDELATSLSGLDPRGPLADAFLATTLGELQAMFVAVDVEDWGAAEKIRRHNLEYEMVILMPTRGEAFTWEPGSEVESVVLIMRRKLRKWFYAGFNDRIAKPGWPPTFDKFPLEGNTIRQPNDPL
ncbi:SEFIR domain-containing protein [Williamsia sp. SKLECPSW1]